MSQTKMEMNQQKEKENEKTTADQKPTQENVPAVKTQSNQVAKKSPVYSLIATARDSFEKANEYNMNFAREANFALQILEGNKYLQGSKPESIRNAIVNVSLTGLTLNPALKYAYLVPRKIGSDLHCILDISYIGMIKLLTDAGAVKSLDCEVIYENDKYDFRKGSEPYLKHTPSLTDRGDAVGVYAIAFFRDGGSQFVILNREEVEKVRSTSESWKNEKGRKYSPWETWTDEMWKKTALKRLFKLLPKTKFSEQLIAAVSHDHDTEMQDVSNEDQHDETFSDVEVVG